MPADMLTKEMFAEAYGWTPDQVDSASLDALTWFPLIREARANAAEIEQKRQARESRNSR